MTNDSINGRREFLASVAALGAVSAAGCAQSPVMAQAAGQLPARGEFVVREAAETALGLQKRAGSP